MKTVIRQGIPVRLSNAEAHKVVFHDKDGEYCPKHVYKEWQKKTAKKEIKQ